MNPHPRNVIIDLVSWSNRPNAKVFNCPDGDVWFITNPIVDAATLDSLGEYRAAAERLLQTKFRVYRSSLVDASHMFRDMFNSVVMYPPEDGTEGTEDKPIPIEVLPSSFNAVLLALDSSHSPDLEGVTTGMLKDIFQFCDKYLLEGVKTSFRRMLAFYPEFETRPLEWYLFSKKMGWVEEQRVALAHCLSQTLDHLIYPSPELEEDQDFANLSRRDFTSILKLWREPRIALQTEVYRFTRPTVTLTQGGSRYDPEEAWFVPRCKCNPTMILDPSHEYDSAPPKWLVAFDRLAEGEIRKDAKAATELMFTAEFLLHSALLGGCDECHKNIFTNSRGLRLFRDGVKKAWHSAIETASKAGPGNDGMILL